MQWPSAWANVDLDQCCPMAPLAYIRLTGSSFFQLSHRGRVTHICVGKLTIIASDKGLSAPSHYLNQYWNIVNLNLRNKLRWNLKWNSYIFIQENAFKYDVCEMEAILSRPPCEWVIKFKCLSGDSRQRGPYNQYKPCNHSLYIGIIIFPHIDNTQSTGHNQL